VGLCTLCFALGGNAFAWHSTKQSEGKVQFVEYKNNDNTPNLDVAVAFINEHSLRIVTTFSRGGTTVGFLCVPDKP